MRQIVFAHAVDGGLGGDVDLQRAAIPDLGNGKGLVYGKFSGAICIGDGVHGRRITAYRLLGEPAAVHGAAVKGDGIHEVAVADLDALASDDLAADKAGKGLEIAAVGHGQGVGVFIVAPVFAGVNALGIGLHAGGVRQAVHDAQLRLDGLTLHGHLDLQRFGDVVAQVADTGHTGFGISGIARAGQGDDRLVLARLGGIHRGRRSIRVGLIHVLHGINNSTGDFAFRLVGGNGQVGGVHLQDGQEDAPHAVHAVRNGAVHRLLKVRVADIILFDIGVLLVTEGVDEIPAIERMRVHADIIANEQEHVVLTVQRVDRIQGGKAGSIRCCDAVEGCVLRNRQHHGGRSSLRVVQEQAACDAAGAGDSAGEEAAVQRAVVDDIALDGRTLSKLRGGVLVDGQGVVLIAHALCIFGDHRCAVFVNGQGDDRGSRSGLLYGHIDVQRFGDEVIQIALQSNAVDQVLLLFGQCGNAVICKQSRCGNDGILVCKRIPIAGALERNMCLIFARNSGIGSKGFIGSLVGIGDTGGFDLGDGDIDLAGGIDAQIAALHVSNRSKGCGNIRLFLRQSGISPNVYRPRIRIRIRILVQEVRAFCGIGNIDRLNPAKRIAVGVAVAGSEVKILAVLSAHNVQRSDAGRVLQAAESSAGGEGEFSGIGILRLIDKQAAFNNAMVGDSAGKEAAVQRAVVDDIALNGRIRSKPRGGVGVDGQGVVLIAHALCIFGDHRCAVFVNGQGDGIGTDLEPPVFRGQRGQGVSGAFVGIRKLMVSAVPLNAVLVNIIFQFIAETLGLQDHTDLISACLGGILLRHLVGGNIGIEAADINAVSGHIGTKLHRSRTVLGGRMEGQLRGQNIQNRRENRIGVQSTHGITIVFDRGNTVEADGAVICAVLIIGLRQQHGCTGVGRIAVAVLLNAVVDIKTPCNDLVRRVGGVGYFDLRNSGLVCNVNRACHAVKGSALGRKLVKAAGCALRLLGKHAAGDVQNTGVLWSVCRESYSLAGKGAVLNGDIAIEGTDQTGKGAALDGKAAGLCLQVGVEGTILNGDITAGGRDKLPFTEVEGAVLNGDRTICGSNDLGGELTAGDADGTGCNDAHFFAGDVIGAAVDGGFTIRAHKNTAGNIAVVQGHGTSGSGIAIVIFAQPEDSAVVAFAVDCAASQSNVRGCALHRAVGGATSQGSACREHCNGSVEGAAGCIAPLVGAAQLNNTIVGAASQRGCFGNDLTVDGLAGQGLIEVLGQHKDIDISLRICELLVGPAPVRADDRSGVVVGFVLIALGGIVRIAILIKGKRAGRVRFTQRSGRNCTPPEQVSPQKRKRVLHSASCCLPA